MVELSGILLKKGDLGGFKNHQWEEIFGKRYKTKKLAGKGGLTLAGQTPRPLQVGDFAKPGLLFG